MLRIFLSVKVLFVLAGMSAALIVAGCGGSGNSTNGDLGEVTVETSSLSKAEFMKRADAICKTNKAQLIHEYKLFVTSALAEAKSNSASKSDEKASQRKLVDTLVVPSFEKDIEEISALGAPKGDEQEITSLLDSLKKELERLQQDPSKVLDASFARTSKMAQAYGLSGCADSVT
jgi:hypothetical protein